MRPLRHCAWQATGRGTSQEVHEHACATAGQTQAARAAAAELRSLGAEAEAGGKAGGGMGPDGVVPSALVEFLVGVGVRRGEAREIAARIVAATCEAVQRASLARAREMAEQLDGMGVHAPELLGGAGRPTAQCECATPATTSRGGFST